MALVRTRTTPATEVFPDRALNTVQTGASQLAAAVNRMPWRTSAVSGPLAFAGGDQKTFYHGLGRTPARWAIEDVTGDAAAVYRVSWDDQKIVIGCLPTFTPTVVIRVGVD